MELKLKRRELKIDVYGGDKEVLRFPSYEENIDYSTALLDVDQNEKEVTAKFLVKLGMTKKAIKSLEFIDMLEVLNILTGQKKFNGQ